MKTSGTSKSVLKTPLAVTVVCKFFNKANGCKFGDKCRYRHEKETDETSRKNDNAAVKTENVSEGERSANNSNISGENSENSGAVIGRVSEKPEGHSHDQQKDGTIASNKRQTRRPICRYFLRSGYCRDGEKCRFFHQTNISKPKKPFDNVHEMSSQHEQLAPDESKLNTNPVPTENLDNFVPVAQKPENLAEKLSELSDEGLKYLQAVEIKQLKKRLAGEDIKITQENHGTVCVFNIKPSDPDWPYDVNEVELIVTFPKDYPKEIFKAEAVDEDSIFPANFTKYINSDIEKHLKEHEEAQKLRDSPDLLFRPFLRWLDRNLESLFTKALKQIKFDVDARSAGLEFVTFCNDDAENTCMDENKELEDKEDKKLEQMEDTVESMESKVDFGDDGDEGDPEIKEEETSKMFDMIEARKLVTSKKGTEVRFRGMELDENTATVRVTSLTFTVQCSRCKNREEMPNVKVNTQVVLTCSKCANAQSIVFTSSEVLHQNSATLAYINPHGCLPIDLILSECQLVLNCLHCSKDTSIKGVNYGSIKNVWCHHCHKKLDMKVESARFYQLQPAVVSDDNIKTIELKKKAKNKDPLIKSGQALPENGTCKHYKKSYRWMRFPCCGKCYPCDKCHDENEDDHEMEQATRMICGFCAKEQAFNQKSCISCKSSVTAVHTSHWEGGKGCRNKTKMSRGDEKKYSDRNKTVSKHAVKVEGQKKK